ncbi:hypothetical protein D1007_19393 [Hordeum vulgare]|nr:hypothetical protein D1007_19393 [Hordeum vulgare]
MDSHFLAAHDTDCETVSASHTVLQQPANTNQTLDASSNRTPNDNNANQDEGMPETTQRTERFNAVLKKYVNPQNSVMDFIRQYAAIQEKIMCAESKQDADTTITTVRKWSYNPIELPMSTIYTRNIFVRFHGEMQLLLSYICKQTDAQEYMVECIAKFVQGYGDKSFKIMVQLGVTTLSATYIIKRWTWLVEEMLVNMSSQVLGKVHEMPQE